MKKRCTLAFIGLSSLSLAQGLLARYDFNGNANDASGNGYHGTVIGAQLTTDRHGNPGSAYLFDGTSNTINCGSMTLNTSHLSIGYWSQRSTLDGNWHAVLSQGTANTYQGLHVGLTGTLVPDQNAGFDIFNAGVYDTTGASSTLWNHWFFTYDYGSGLVSIYLNGALIKSSVTGGTYSGTGNVYIGSTAWGGNYFEGSIDEVKIYTALLTATQIDSIFQAEAQCTGLGLTEISNNVSCNGTMTGYSTVTASAGFPPYNYFWSHGPTSNTVTGLGAATYTCLVTDNSGCQDSIEVAITEPVAFNVAMTATNVTCNGGTDGSAEALVSGGTPPYSYSWPPLNEYNSTIINFPAGSYTCNISDINGCTTSDTISIYQPGPFTATMTVSSATVCTGQPDTLAVSVTGGNSPFWYEWHDFSTSSVDTTYDTTFVIEPVATGSAVVGVYIFDILGCQAYASNNFFAYAGDSLSGTAYLPGLSPVTSGKAYLFREKMTGNGLGDTIAILNIGANGYYSTPSLYWGNYYLEVNADTTLYPNAIGTYYSASSNAYQWDSALVISHKTCAGGHNSGKDVTVIEIMPQTGPGDISGTVFYVPGYGNKAGPGGFAPQGAPLKGVDVKLGKNPGGSAAARTTTDQGGNYTFDNVPLGDYKIYVDIPNYGMDSTRTVSLTSTDSVSIKNDYYVDSVYVYVLPHFNIVVNASLCAGDSMLAGGGYQQTSGTYSDSLINTLGGDSIVTTNLTVFALPSVTAVASADTICAGNSVTLTGSGADVYLWTGSVIDGFPFNPVATDTYTVTGIDTNGCQNTASITVTVESCVGIASANGDAGLYAFPNPAIDQVTLVSPSIPVGVQVLHVSGEIVLKNIRCGKRTTIDVSGLPAGVYFIKVQLDRQRSGYLKVLKQ